NGTVIRPHALLAEMKDFSNLEGRLFVSQKAHLILAYHEAIDRIKESTQAIGTTGKGIGPAYTDKIARCGARMGELCDKEKLLAKIQTHLDSPIMQTYRAQAQSCNIPFPTIQEIREEIDEAQELLPYITDTTAMLWDALDNNERILLEGAQGSMLDIDHGTYPFVTSSSTLACGACAGTGLAPNTLRRIIGVTKAYCTRVGNGIFPTEDNGYAGDFLRQKGNEFGTTTGRARRCGWLDLVALKTACRLNGCTEIAMMKLDVFDGCDTIKVCTAYEQDGKNLSYFPYSYNHIKPIYTTMNGWEQSAGTKTFIQLPKAARDYIHFIEEQIKVRISFLSTGADREDTIERWEIL
ncbi:MAG: adenylosuccinate synthase, partial [Helicobacter sp.]|nr:adenylosuccinate synthase [Helicobacter sp.]